MTKNDSPPAPKLIITDKRGLDEAPTEDRQAERAAPPFVPEHPHRNCRDCDYSFFPVNRVTGVVSNAGQCRIKPPQTYTIFVPTQIGQPQELSTSVWPIVYDRQNCGEFERKPELQQ